jgi:hypothetical protein
MVPPGMPVLAAPFTVRFTESFMDMSDPAVIVMLPPQAANVPLPPFTRVTVPEDSVMLGPKLPVALPLAAAVRVPSGCAVLKDTPGMPLAPLAEKLFIFMLVGAKAIMLPAWPEVESVSGREIYFAGVGAAAAIGSQHNVAAFACGR